MQQQVDARLERAGGLFGPVHAHPALAVALEQAFAHAAFGGVYHQAFAAAQVAHDVVARNGPAARRHLHRSALAAVDDHQALRGHVVIGAITAHGQRQRVGLGALFGQQPGQPLGHDGGNLAPQADVDKQLGLGAVAAPAREPLPDGGARGVASRKLQAFGAQRLGQHFFAQVLRLLLLHVLQVVANLGACAAGAHKVEPGRVGPRAGCGDHLDHVAAAQLGAQGHGFTIDLGGHTMVAHVGVNGVGKVHRRGTARQCQDLGFGREHINRVGVQVDLDVLEKLRRVARFVLNVDQRLHPHGAQALRLLGMGRAALKRLVHPVRRNAFFGHGVHGLGANLELHGRAQRAHQRGVQRLVAVGLGDGDVVFEAPRNRLEQLVQDAHGQVTLGQAADDDAKAEDVIHLRKRQTLFAHLVVDGKQRFLAAVDLHGQLGLRKRLFHIALNALNDVAPVAACLLHRLGQRPVAPRPKVLERQLLQFAVGLVQAQPVRNGRVNVQRVAGHTHAFGRGHRVHGAHVVQAVGQLDEDHAHVARHRQQHFAEGLGLRFFTRRELQLVELGQPVHQLGGGRTKAFDQLDLGDAAVFHRVVHERGHDGLHIELPVGTQAGHGDRVGDVGFTAGAELAQVGFVSKAVGFAHAFQIGGVEIVELAGEGGK